MSGVSRLTRAVFVLGVGLTVGTGAALWAFPHRTEDYWAWPIAAEPTAAFLGAAFLGAAVALGLAAREPAWQRARLVAVLAFALTSLALLVTLLNLDPFALDEGGIVGTIAWIWLVVYVTLPPLVLTAFVLQERAGGGLEYGGPPIRETTRLGAAGAGVVLGVYGVALMTGWDLAESWWPWPLTPLTAGIVGGWLATYSVGLLWFAFRDPHWRRSRIGAIGLAVTAILDLAAAVRFWDNLDGGAQSVVYVAVLLAVLAGLAVAAFGDRTATAGRATRSSHPG